MESTSALLPEALAAFNSFQEVLNFAQTNDESYQLVNEHLSSLVQHIIQSIPDRNNRASPLVEFINETTFDNPSIKTLGLAVSKNIAENILPEHIKNEIQRRNVLESLLRREADDIGLFKVIESALPLNGFVALSAITFLNVMASHPHANADTYNLVIGTLRSILDRGLLGTKKKGVLDNLTELLDTINGKAIDDTYLEALIQIATDDSTKIAEAVRCLMLNKVIESSWHNRTHLDRIADFSDHIKSNQLKTDLLNSVVSSDHKTSEHEQNLQLHNRLTNLNSFQDLLQEVRLGTTINNIEEIFASVLNKSPRTTLAQDLNLFFNDIKSEGIYIDLSLEIDLEKCVTKCIVEGDWQQDERVLLSNVLSFIAKDKKADNETRSLIANNCKTFIPVDNDRFMRLLADLADHSDISAVTLNTLMSLAEECFNELISKDEQTVALPIIDFSTEHLHSAYGADVTKNQPLLNSFVDSVIQYLEPNDINSESFNSLISLYQRVMPIDNALDFLTSRSQAVTNKPYFSKLTQQVFIRLESFENIIQQSDNHPALSALILQNAKEIINGILKSTADEDLYKSLTTFLNSSFISTHPSVSRELIKHIIENIYPDYLDQQRSLRTFSQLFDINKAIEAPLAIDVSQLEGDFRLPNEREIINTETIEYVIY